MDEGGINPIAYCLLVHGHSEASNNNAVNVSKFSKAPRPVTKLSNLKNVCPINPTHHVILYKIIPKTDAHPFR